MNLQASNRRQRCKPPNVSRRPSSYNASPGLRHHALRLPEVPSKPRKGRAGRRCLRLRGRALRPHERPHVGGHPPDLEALHDRAVRRAAGNRVLDIAGGTGDLAAKFAPLVGDEGEVVLADINASMLRVGRDRLIDRGVPGNLYYVQADAQHLPFPDDHFDCITIAFGLRNVTDKDLALRSMLRVLKPGGRLLVLEFSKPRNPLLSARLRRLLLHRAAGHGPPRRRRQRQLPVPRRVDPRASGPGDAARHDGRRGLRALRLPRHDRRRSSPCTAASRPA
jgi:SAM-dependent methyltransferase